MRVPLQAVGETEHCRQPSAGQAAATCAGSATVNVPPQNEHVKSTSWISALGMRRLLRTQQRTTTDGRGDLRKRARPYRRQSWVLITRHAPVPWRDDGRNDVHHKVL